MAGRHYWRPILGRGRVAGRHYWSGRQRLRGPPDDVSPRCQGAKGSGCSHPRLSRMRAAVGPPRQCGNEYPATGIGPFTGGERRKISASRGGGRNGNPKVRWNSGAAHRRTASCRPMYMIQLKWLTRVADRNAEKNFRLFEEGAVPILQKHSGFVRAILLAALDDTPRIARDFWSSPESCQGLPPVRISKVSNAWSLTCTLMRNRLCRQRS